MSNDLSSEELRDVGGHAAPEYEPRRPVRSFVRTVRAIVLCPTTFFVSLASAIASEGQDREERLGPPVLFVMSTTLVFVALGGAYDLAAMALQGELQSFTAFGVEGWAALAIVAAILAVAAPLGAAVVLFIGAFLLHIPVMLFAGRQRRSYYATLKIFAYTSVTALLAWIPVVWLLASVYGVYLTAVGVRELHRSTPARAAVVALVLLVVNLATLLPAPVELILTGGLG